MPESTIEFVFSFRSPYAWLAAECIVPRLPDSRSIRWRPFYPLPRFTNFNAEPLAAKTRYLVKDITRLADFYGVGPIGWPAIAEPDWVVPHAAFERAHESGVGPAFALEIYAARWKRGEDISDDAVLRRAAEASGADPEEIAAASRDSARHAALVRAIEADYENRGIFGVPTLITPWKTRFWGHDRIEWALAHGHLEPPAASAAG